MEKFKRAISVLVAVFMLTALIPVMAQAADIADLTCEDIVGHQPANMITSALTLPEGYTWTAEPSGVINTTTGAVTRHALEDKAVVLTAEAGGETKNFELVIKSKKTKILTADTFAYDYEEGIVPVTQNDFIFTSIKTEDVNKILKEADGNSYFALDWTYNGSDANIRNSKAVSLKNVSEDFASADVVYISFKYKYIGSNLAFMKLYPGDVNTQAAAIGYNSGTFGYSTKWQYDTPRITYSNYLADGTDAWKTAYYKYDVTNNTGSISDDGVTWKAAKNLSTTNFSTLENKALTQISLNPSSVGSDCGKLYVDDFVIYTESADNLTAEDIEEYIQDEISIENITSEKISAVTSNLTLPTAGGLVTWTSSNEDVITSDGKIARSNDINAITRTATLTAEYDGGNKVYNIVTLPEYYDSVDALTIDFEEGIAGNAITPAMVTNLMAQATYKGWGGKENTTPSINYKYDDNKGLVGEIVNTDGTKSIGYSAGGAIAAQRFITGFDLNLNQLGEGKFTVEMNGALTYQKLVFTQNTVTVSVDNTTKVYEITPDANGWIRVDVDNNWAARSQNIYVNGVALTGTLKNMIYTSANTNGHGGSPYRTIVFTINGAGSVLLDNITASKHVETLRQPAIMADAGLKAVELFYSDKFVEDGTVLEQVGPGPLFGAATDISTSLANQTTAHWTSATITYDATCVTEGVFSADKPAEYVLNVTASAARKDNYPSSTTGTITIKGAPVVIKEANGNIEVSGASSGGTLIVAQYNEDGKMTSAKTYTTFENISVPAESYKVFFIKDLSSLAPTAFVLEK